MKTLTYREAIQEALADAMAADDRVFMLGEDIGAAGGAFKLTDGLFDRFGEKRVLDTPISEQAIVGASLGAAVRGLRPVAEIMFADFAAVCFDGIVNEIPKYRYMTGGQVTVPLTIRLGNGAGAGFGAQHSQACENWFLNVPGLKIAVPATPADMYGLLRGAIEDPDPVLVFEHKNLFNQKGPVPDDAGPLPLGSAEVVCAGEDVTIVATQWMRGKAEAAAAQLAERGVGAELIDPRTLVPFDFATVAASVERTNRLVIVQESPADGSWGASLLARVTQEQFELLDAPPVLLAADPIPLAYAEELEAATLPSAEGIVAAVEAALAF